MHQNQYGPSTSIFAKKRRILLTDARAGNLLPSCTRYFRKVLVIASIFGKLPAPRTAAPRAVIILAPFFPSFPSHALSRPYRYGWAFGLLENFGSGNSGFGYFGFPKILPEISLKKEEPENSGTRKFGFGFTRITRISHTSHIKFHPHALRATCRQQPRLRSQRAAEEARPDWPPPPPKA